MAYLILNKYDINDIMIEHFRMGSFTADDVISFTVSNYDAGLSLLPQPDFNSSVVKIQINTPSFLLKIQAQLLIHFVPSCRCGRRRKGFQLDEQVNIIICNRLLCPF